jgi:Polysaccharide lyase
VTPPSVTSTPTISGTAQQGQTLTSSTGSWSGTTPLSYAYQWQRCDSGGANCVPVTGANSTNFLLGSADVGSSLRISVTATNSGGSATASSPATAAVTASPSAGSPSVPPYFVGSFEAGTLSQWSIIDSDAVKGYTPDVNLVGSPVNTGSGAVGLTATSTSNGAADPAQAPSSDYTSIWLPKAMNWGAYNGTPQETWYHTRVYFPTDYRPTTGEWNFFQVWHIDDTTGQNSGGAAKSAGFAVDTWAPGGTKIKLRWGAGPTTAPVLQDWYDPNPLQLGHWYDEKVRVIWSCNPSQGHVQWWQDGVLLKDVNEQTLYSRTNGTCGYVGFGLYNYRLHASWPSTIYFDDVVIGPTLSSVQ